MCEAQRCARLRELGVAEQHFEASSWSSRPSSLPSSLPSSEFDSLRVMQLNILADAMSDDGFLVRPVLANWPVRADAVPTAEGGEADFSTLLKEMMAAKGKMECLQECQRKYTCNASAENTRAVIDWEARKLQMMCLIEHFSPDILVLAELDHYSDFLATLRELGYESQLERCKEDQKTVLFCLLLCVLQRSILNICRPCWMASVTKKQFLLQGFQKCGLAEAEVALFRVIR